MVDDNFSTNEETLDPPDWQAMRELGHRMVDDMFDYLHSVRERPAWQPIPAETVEFFQQPLPQTGEGAGQAYQQFLTHIRPYPLGNIHPRFWGWVVGTGTPLGMLSELLAGGMNTSVFGADQAASRVESQVIEWCKQMLGFPVQASGLLVTGGTMANLVGITVARNSKADFDLANQGLAGAGRQFTLYGSSEMHSSMPKAMQLLGLGANAVRKIPVDCHYQIDLLALERQIRADRAAGYQPFCIVGNAGTVNTGAIDDLARLAEISAAEGLWFHVDGAFGAVAALSQQQRDRLIGMERADSLAFDLHKWLYMPYDVGCVLVQHPEQHRQAFTFSGDYLTHANRGTAGGVKWFSEYGVELSRSFRALKVWMSFKEHGIKKYQRLIEQNLSQARYLAERISQYPELELLAPVSLNIVCFRFNDARLNTEQLNRLNQELLFQLQESGIAVPTSTLLQGRFAIRVAIVNHRSRRDDFDLLVEKVRQIGKQLLLEQL